MKIITWNIKKRPLEDVIFDLGQAELPDILVLFECTINTVKLLEKLNSVKSLYFHTSGKAKNIKIFTLFSSKFVNPLEERNKYSILKISLPCWMNFFSFHYIFLIKAVGVKQVKNMNAFPLSNQ